MASMTGLAALSGSLLTGIVVVLLIVCIRPIWDAVTRRYVADLTPLLRDLSMDTMQLPVYLRWWGAAMLAVGLGIGLGLGMPVLAAPAVFLVYQAPRFLLRRRIGHRRVLLRDQMVSSCVGLANAARAGLALPQGLEAITPETPEPLAAEFRRLNREFQHGRAFADGLRDTQKRLNFDSFTLFTAALLVCMERGGKITEALERIAHSLQENQRLERKLESDTGSGRKVVFILACCPVGFLLMFAFLDPEGTALLFHMPLGQAILLIVAALTYGSVRWARRILKLDGAY